MLDSRDIRSEAISSKTSICNNFVLYFLILLQALHNGLHPARRPNDFPRPSHSRRGPVGMLTALRLAQLGVPCTLCEMNTETTRWPKMGNNSCHTMEILRIMGFAEEYRQQPGAIPQHSEWDTIFFNTCGQKKKLVSRWVCLPYKKKYPLGSKISCQESC